MKTHKNSSWKVSHGTIYERGLTMSSIDTFIKQKAMENMWEISLQRDERLRDGIRQNLPFYAFQQKTGCPGHLQKRYEELQLQAKQEVERQSDKFLEGFLSENGSYIP